MLSSYQTCLIIALTGVAASHETADVATFNGYVTPESTTGFYSPVATHHAPSPTFSMSMPSTWKVFKTEPTFRPESFEITHMTQDPTLLAPGYLFIDPTFKPSTRGLGPWGPQIYDQEGQLVWHGEDGFRSQDFHACDYLGSRGTHLCLHKRLRQKNWTFASRKFGVASGIKLVLDQTYSAIGQGFTATIAGFGPNGHEFNDVNQGQSFLQPVYVLKSADLSGLGGEADGYVSDACFQDVDFRNGQTIFGWCWLDHLPIEHSTLYPNFADPSKHVTSKRAGSGTRSSPWDFAHLNSMDKTSEGDYIISVRHCDQIVKIAGVNNVHGVEQGTVLWQLGGKSNDFTANFTFGRQHSIRVISTKSSETVISLLNNNLIGKLRGSPEVSAGQIISIDNSTMEASLLRTYPQPDGVSTGGKGNVQTFGNKNVLIGWGFLPAVTEYDHNGTVLYHARFTGGLIRGKGLEGLARFETSYRAFKAPWVGKPHWKPKLLAYSLTCSTNRASPLVAYVSWNGATEVEKWRFSTAITQKGPWYPAGTFPKHDFETKARLSNVVRARFGSFATFVSVEAIDARGQILSSAITKVFVPNSKISARCDIEGCKPDTFEYKRSLSKIGECSRRQVPAYLPFVLVILLVEALSYLANLTCVFVGTNSQSHEWEPVGDEDAAGDIEPETEKRDKV